MADNNLQRQIAAMRKALFDEGYLDEQFIQLEELQDETNPCFVEDVVTLYFRDSARVIHNIEQTLEKRPIDFHKLDSFLHQFKGSSSSIGARKVKMECTRLAEYCSAGDVQGCMMNLLQVKRENATLQRKLESYLQVVRQASPSDYD